MCARAGKEGLRLCRCVCERQRTRALPLSLPLPPPFVRVCVCVPLCVACDLRRLAPHILCARLDLKRMNVKPGISGD